MKITREWLKSRYACSKDLAVFAAEWPDGVELSLEALNRAAELDLDLDWFADNIFEGPAWTEHEKIMGPAWTEHEKIMGPAWAEYKKIEGPARAEYLSKLAATIWEVYSKGGEGD